MATINAEVNAYDLDFISQFNAQTLQGISEAEGEWLVKNSPLKKLLEKLHADQEI